jgi:acetylornithine/succinyldiaminopimelate/putrescine aminotransferase
MATGEPRWRERFHHELPGFTQVPFGDPAALDAALGDDTAALILETIPATLGMPLPPPGYHARAAQLCRERGVLLVLDEVQTGLGRCGTVWAHEQDAVEPDLITTGKGLSGGLYPIAATLMRPEIHALYAEDPFIHISTFGGAEPGCAAALAVLDVIQAPGFLERVEAVGAEIEAGLAGLGCEIRRRGLFLGLKFPGEGDGIGAARRLFDHGIFAVFAANDPSVTQFLPPLVITDAEAQAIVEAARAALG